MTHRTLRTALLGLTLACAAGTPALAAWPFHSGPKAPKAAAAPVLRRGQVDPLAAARGALRTRDYATALQLLGRQANEGNAEAQLLLGLMHLNGVGVPIDEAQATTWLRKSADLGNGDAAYVLAALLHRQHPDDHSEAKAMLARAAAAGYAAAIEDQKLGRLPLSPDWAGLGDSQQRLQLAIWGARQGDSATLALLGDGLGALKDEFGAGLLAHAVAGGSLPGADYLLAHGADANAVDSFGVTPLMLAAGLEEGALLELLLAHGAKVGATDSAKRTALFHAARADRPAAVARLVKAGARIDATDLRNYSALDAALALDATHSAAALRQLGAKSLAPHGSGSPRDARFDPARPGEIYRGWPVVALAVARSDARGAQGLLAAGADPDTRTAQGDPLLHVALHAAAPDMFKMLLAAHAAPLQPDRRGRTVLALAAGAGKLPAVNALLAAGVAADAHGPREATPLLAAVYGNHLDVAQRLLEADAQVNAADVLGETPLLAAASSGNALMVQLLVTHGAQVRTADLQGQTALWRAARIGSLECVQLLLAAGADVEAVDKEGRTALMNAAAEDHAPIVAALLEARAQPDVRSASGDTALLVASGHGHDGVVRLLLQRKAAVDLQNKNGDTALMAASRAGNLVACRALLAAGASKSLRNYKRSTAADVARDRGFREVADAIEGKSQAQG